MSLFPLRSILYGTALSFAVLASISGCSKESNSEPSYTLEPTGLSYIQIPLGRYFIYKDSATLQLDSVVVTESTLENLHTTSQSAFGQFYYQKYKLWLTKKDSANSRWLSGEATAMFNSTEFSMMSTWAPDGYEVGNLFNYPIGRFNFDGRQDSAIGTMTVEGKTYNNVVRITGTHSFYSVYYWAKGVGIIKRIKGGQTLTTYTLVRNG